MDEGVILLKKIGIQKIMRRGRHDYTIDGREIEVNSSSLVLKLSLVQFLTMRPRAVRRGGRQTTYH